MAKNSKWQDDYWLLLMQIYLQKPVGVKSMYSRGMIDLCMELHIAPNLLFNKMCEMANLDTPRIEHLWETSTMPMPSIRAWRPARVLRRTSSPWPKD